MRCAWCGVPLVPSDGTWTDVAYGSGDYCPEGKAVGPTGTSPHLPLREADGVMLQDAMERVIAEARFAAAKSPAIATTGRLRLRVALDEYDRRFAGGTVPMSDEKWDALGNPSGSAAQVRAMAERNAERIDRIGCDPWGNDDICSHCQRPRSEHVGEDEDCPSSCRWCQESASGKCTLHNR